MQAFQGQPDDELAALAEPVASDLDRALVQRDQLLHQREPDAEAAGRDRACPVGLREHLEDAREHVRGDANARVLEAHDGLLSLDRRLHPEGALRGRVLDRVLQQVVENLREAFAIGFDLDRAVREEHAKVVALLVELRARGIGDFLQELLHHDGTDLQLHFPGADARGVEQVIHQAAKDIDLALDHA